MAEYRISIRQGDAFDFSATLKSGSSPVDLSGYTSEMVITWAAKPGLVAGEVNLSMDALGDDGVIGAHLTAEQTGAMPVGGRVVDGALIRYQLRISSGGDPQTILAGNVDVLPDLFELVS